MNKLVEYLNRYQYPGGNSVNTVLVDDLIFEMELTREELFNLATDPKVKKMIIPRFNVKDWTQWRGHTADELESIGIWNQVLLVKPMVGVAHAALILLFSYYPN